MCVSFIHLISEKDLLMRSGSNLVAGLSATALVVFYLDTEH